ncbi:aromatic ring-hydroxylating oxygenase subunit alpha [Fimbriiglobus ruber]|uniref:Choline monooxygenase-like protein with aromatic-ring-hydroxylating dioxygenase domain n=1 Tax=Fimbriiglobus ruber TaxID=1908690 RepID=A0A225DGM5_9BACT|nr:SRPBCC family protein [Fimbriiglobus ruber]OWK36516.1 Choline monooxygenase-like protein with aromatic-ring-hydroxylating dioxygenase domain [Fimbriiglobus ruber]
MPADIRDLLTAFDPTLPLDRASTIPASWYTDPRMFAAERETVFSRSWQVAGRADQLREPGAYVTAEVAGEPVLVVRGDDGVLRGFFNVCRHRATSLVTAPCGTVSKLRCRYHGWTYDLTGRLRGTPEFDGVCDFRKEDNGLIPVGAVAEWGPYVWVHLDPPREPLEAFLASLPEWAASNGSFGNLPFATRVEYEVACNWKTYVDNYLDGGYHVNTVHPGLANVLNYQEYTTTTYARTSLQTAPITPATGAEGQTRTGDRAAYWWVYPNLMVNLYAGVMDTNLVVPLAPDRCRVVFDYYFAPSTPADFIQNSIAVADQVQKEDMAICEDVQRGLASRAYTTGRFSVKRENGGYHFHQMLARALREERTTW